MTSPRHPYVARVAVENFRSIRKLDVGLPAFAVLVGPNGSGKTNFVLALSLLGELLRRGTTEPAEDLGWEEIVRRTRKRSHHIKLGATVQIPGRLVEDQRPEPPAEPEPVEVDIEVDLKPGEQGSILVDRERLRVRRGTDNLEVVIVADRLTAKVEGRPEIIDLLLPPDARSPRARALFEGEVGATRDPEERLREYFRPRLHADDQERRYLHLLSVPRFYSRLVLQAASACAITRIRLDATALRSDSAARGALGEAGQGLAAAVAVLRGTKDKPKRDFEPVLEALREVFPRVEDVVPVRIGPGKLVLTFRERGVPEPFGQASVSDGVLHALALLLGLAGPGRAALAGWAGLLAIEEPENAIHPWSIRVLMERMQRSHRRQMLLTTHSVEVVNQVKDPASLLVCEVSDDGTSITPALSKETALASILKETGQRLGEIWQGGGLGGVPGETP